MSIKELQARSAVPRGKPYKLADGGGLFLLVQPSGSKLWRMKYRFGAYPAISLSAAREKRLNAKHTLSLGKDPMAGMVQSSVPHDKSFEVIAKRWHKNRASSLDPAHAARVWSRIERDVIPAIGHMHIEEIAGLVTVWFRSLVSHYATLASKAKGLMPPRDEWRRRAL